MIPQYPSGDLALDMFSFFCECFGGAGGPLGIAIFGSSMAGVGFPKSTAWWQFDAANFSGVDMKICSSQGLLMIIDYQKQLDGFGKILGDNVMIHFLVWLGRFGIIPSKWQVLSSKGNFKENMYIYTYILIHMIYIYILYRYICVYM